ncbi:threonine synthase-like 2 [Penaeus vannamei]|uniref:threonine synthase-like 2 n=1 Tax=Penaeus vannamei TaxID=6689 RepID=UPI00387FA2A1
MKYCSTRGKEKGLSFKDVLFSGYAKDGGLYMPEVIPKLNETEVKEWSTHSYPELVYLISRKFISEEEIPSHALKDIINGSLKRFRTPKIIEIERLEGGLNIVELFHGTTLAFKDLALSVVGGLLDFFLKENSEHVTVLIGTSGDTGSAAIESVRGRESIDIVVLLPHGRCTHIQELQMTTVIEDNVHVYCVDGTSDELDEPIKRCFADEEFVAKHRLISINSINWGRIMAQVAHYFYTYYQLCSFVGQPLKVVVPTGAAGNITAGCLAQKMGLPITLVAGVNTNDIVARTLSRGDFSIRENVCQTLAPAMDIQVPYNVERLIYLHTNGDTKRVKEVMDSYEEVGKAAIPEDILRSLKNIVVDTLVVDDSQITVVMEKVYKEHKYILCPHTATAAAYHYMSKEENPRGYIATASPAKFPEAVEKAGAQPVTEGVSHLKDLPTKFMWMKKGEDWYSILRNRIEAISSKKE